MQQITVYKEIYHQPVNQISVPKELQNQAFEVTFVPIEKQEKPKFVSALDVLMAYDGVDVSDIDFDLSTRQKNKKDC
ncbi:hypothetical protein ACEYX6_03040 [Acinetobacter sp. c2-A9]|uniref:hypothetical protein n=1 Tax=Acinetobacter sp. c2-A9 TaxID=3342802 RepID=UPI0035B82BEE